jgi:hypothetical protein
MPIQTVAISNTFNELRVATNSVIDEVNNLSNGVGNIIIDSITANTYVGVSSNLNISGNTGSDVVSLTSETLRVVGTNGITTNINSSSNTISVDLGSSLSLSTLALTGATANTFDITGGIRLNGTTTGYVGLQVATSGTNQTYTLPASDGLSGQVLQTDGVGSLSWVNQSAGGGGGGGGSGTSTSRTAFTATGGQTTFSLTYTVGQIDVYMNGSKLVANNDFTATNGTSIVLATGAVAGDVIDAVTYSSQWISSGSNLYYADGNIGVGTTNPSARIHAASANTAFAVGTIRLDGANATGVIDAPTTINAVTGGGAGNGGSQLYFQTRAENGSLTERLRINQLGRVGIGTVTPNTELDVIGTVTATTFSGSGASLSSINATSITTGTVGTARLATGTANTLTYLRGDQTWATVSAGGDGATITNDTTTNASTYYPVLANNQTSGTLSAANTSSTKLYYNPSTGTLNATVFNSLSDESLKENVSIISNAVSTVRQLEGVSFTWKENGIKSYGVIAQQLEKILPELVAGDDKKTVNYSGLIAFLINSIKELDDRVRQLEAK